MLWEISTQKSQCFKIIAKSLIFVQKRLVRKRQLFLEVFVVKWDFLEIFNHCVFYLWIQAKMGLFSAAVIDTFPPRVESVACLRTHCQFGSISRDLQPAKTQYWQIRWAKLSRTPDNLEIGKKVGKWHFSSTKVTVCQKSLMITIFTSPHTRSKVNMKTALKLIFKNGKIYQN